MSTHRLRLAAAILAVASVAVVPSALGAPDAGSRLNSESTNLWFVELSTTPSALKSKASALGISYTERFRFSTLWQGVSIKVDPAKVGMLKQISGVEAVYPVYPATIDPIEANDPALATALAMTGADVAQSELGLSGEGVRVAVMDTGIDYNHADLGGSGVDGDAASDDGTFDGDFPNSRVVAGWDFVGDAFNANPNAPGYNPNAVPDPDPDDCQGHGTHVAGIVGASGGVVGVAPAVEFGAYRVFGCDGSTTADIMLAAMERALADEMDILNMSIGSAFMTWPQYPTAAGSDALVDKGVIVVASIGNSGANGVYSAGAPGVGNKVIGVASFDNSHINALTFRTNPTGTQVAYLQLSNTTEAPTSGTTPELAYVGRGCLDSTSDTYLADPSGKVALIDRGQCTFQEKYQNAIDAGAVAVVVANNVPGLFAGGGVTDRGYPAVGISKADGDQIKAEMAAGPVTLTWTEDRVNAQNPNGGRASSFTSYGMTAELKLKPNIGAPGGLIRSTYPLEKGAYAILSGTSMSSPHVAGAAALYLEAKPGSSAEQVKTAFQNSADPIPWANPNFIEVVHRQGAGMVDIDDAVQATASVSPSEVSLGEGTGGSFTLTIRNNGTSDVTYSLSHLGALTTFGSTNAPSFHFPGATVAFDQSSVTVAAGGSATVGVTVTTIASRPDRSQYGGYIVLTPGDDGGPLLRVPYAGFKGDYQSIQALTSGRCSLPALFKLGGSTTCDAGVDPIQGATRQDADGAVFTTKDGDYPYFVVHLEHQARSIDFTVLDAATGLPITGKGALKRNPTFAAEDYLPRNSLATSFFAWVWDGTLTRSTPAGDVVNPVPDGSYNVQLRLLKALGDPANPADWETWTSPTFTIDRP